MEKLTDRRHTDLTVSALTFLRQHELHPDPAAFLAHGYIALCLRAWPTATGAPLHLATHWAVWTWLTDDVFDRELRDAPPEEVGRLALGLLNTVAEAHSSGPGDHPVVGALADLVEETRAVMPDHWWERYRQQLAAWIHAAHEKLTDFLQPCRTPTLRQYLTIRPPDGGMLLAAMWCELAEQCITPEWHDPIVQSLLSAFSACGYLVNDLAAGQGDTFTALDALVHTTGLRATVAREKARELLWAEERRFWVLRTALREDAGGPSRDTSRFALHLELFWHALREWTTASSRYTLAAPEATK